MTIDDLPNTFYHGTVSVYEDSLLNGIDLARGYKSVDFGQGFYTTSNLKQVLDIARNRARLHKLQYNIVCKPLVMEYTIDKAKLHELKGLIFDSPDGKWYEFIYNNRVGEKYCVSNFHNLKHRYEYVYGNVADSKITNLINKVQQGKIFYGEFYNSMIPLKTDTYNQLSVHSEKAKEIFKLKSSQIID